MFPVFFQTDSYSKPYVSKMVADLTANASRVDTWADERGLTISALKSTNTLSLLKPSNLLRHPEQLTAAAEKDATHIGDYINPETTFSKPLLVPTG